MDAPTRSETQASRTLARQRTGWSLLAVLAVAATILAVAVVVTDLDAIADAGWRQTALWATGTAVVLLGVALATVAWNLGFDLEDYARPGSASAAAAVAVALAVVAVGVAGERGGELARSTPTEPPAGAVEGEDRFVDEGPLGPEDAFVVDNLTAAALPVEERTLVTLELTPSGRRLLAGAMNCETADLAENQVLGTAIGGSWVQPLVVVGPPVRENGRSVARCQRVTVRLPASAGVALPRL